MNISKLEPELPWWVGLIALVFLYFLFRMLNMYSAKNRVKIDAKEHVILAKENVYDPFTNTQNN